jgi:hypothetical protein
MTPLTLTPAIADFQVATADEAKRARDELLRAAGLVSTITDRLDADDATAALKLLVAFERDVEAGRTAAKAPFLEMGRKIDALGKELCLQVSAERTRISKLVGSFEAEERRKAEEERKRLEAEAARVAREAEVAVWKAASEAKTVEERDRKTDAVIEKAAAAVVQIKQEVVNLAPKKVEGSKLLKAVRFEVTDIAALYAARPEFCSIEPNGTAIRAVLKGSPNLQVPGLRHWVEETLSV